MATQTTGRAVCTCIAADTCIVAMIIVATQIRSLVSYGETESKDLEKRKRKEKVGDQHL